MIRVEQRTEDLGTAATVVAMVQRQGAIVHGELIQRRLSVQRGINEALTEVAPVCEAPLGETRRLAGSHLTRDYVQRAVALAESERPADQQLMRRSAATFR